MPNRTKYLKIWGHHIEIWGFFTPVLASLQGKRGNGCKVGIVGDEKGVAGKGGGADDGVGEFQSVVAAQVKGQLNQTAVVMGQGHDLNPLAKVDKAGAVTLPESPSKARNSR